jgi:hypothetical protein
MKRRLFISQPFTGYDEAEIAKQRKALHKVFAAFIGEKPGNVELINQLNPEDPADVRGNFRSDKEQDFYRFCRSIGLLGIATDIILYGDWAESRGCKLEVEIMNKFDINFFDQKVLIAFCMKNKMIEELEELWPKEAELFRKTMLLKSVSTTMVTVPAITSSNVTDDEIVVSHKSTLPKEGKVFVLRYPTNGTILELNVRETWDESKFPMMDSHPELVYVSSKTGSELLMDMDQWGDILTLIIPDEDEDEPSEEEIQKVLDDAYPLCVIKDRYGGTYSGGEYTAWCCGVGYIPDGVFEDDITCGSTWGGLKEARKKGEAAYGIGETPDDALRDLAKAMIRNSKIINEENE